MKVAYQTGKGNKHLVPVLIPESVIEPLNTLTNMEVRSLAGVAAANEYVFPSTQGSWNHVSGWHSVHNVCQKVEVKNLSLLTATKNRHRVSTLFSAMEIPEGERTLFYKHMGHSANVNENIYQAPLALMEIVKVGKRLNDIDGNYYFLLFNN